MAILQTIIYTISSGLLYPVMILLVLLSIWMVITSGRILSEWIIRLRLKKNIDISDYLQKIQKANCLPDNLEQNLPLNIQLYTQKIISLYMFPQIDHLPPEYAFLDLKYLTLLLPVML